MQRYIQLGGERMRRQRVGEPCVSKATFMTIFFLPPIKMAMFIFGLPTPHEIVLYISFKQKFLRTKTAFKP